jgi:hypothetical protein
MRRSGSHLARQPARGHGDVHADRASEARHAYDRGLPPVTPMTSPLT